MGLLLAFVILSISISFLCSILEAVLLSITPSYIVQQRETRPRLHGQLKALKDRIDQPLAGILTLNTIAHTFGAAGVGAQVGVVFGDGYLALASAVMTLLILVLSEIIPKTLGAMHWQPIAPYLPFVLNIMTAVMKPAIKASDLITRWMGYSAPTTDLRSEIKSLTNLGRETAELDEDEQRVISNILDLHEVKLRDIMTPRTVCEYLDVNDTVGAVIPKLEEEVFSRYPVLGKDEHPHGIAFQTDLLGAPPDSKVSQWMRPAQIFTDETSAEAAFSTLLAEHQHMGLVYDQYGTWLGLVTLEDILETILGMPIIDETDDIPNMRRFARKRWENRLKRGSRIPDEASIQASDRA
ncbi:MAG: hypothetical protein RLZZ385_1249 [Pseudomonadota bacterium]|jgi:CBS domain containing-hemolysin-like protein